MNDFGKRLLLTSLRSVDGTGGKGASNLVSLNSASSSAGVSTKNRSNFVEGGAAKRRDNNNNREDDADESFDEDDDDDADDDYVEEDEEEEQQQQQISPATALSRQSTSASSSSATKTTTRSSFSTPRGARRTNGGQTLLPHEDLINLKAGTSAARRSSSGAANRWNPREDHVLRIAVDELNVAREEDSMDLWRMVALRVGTRDAKTCMTHWKKTVKPGWRKGTW